MRVFISGISGTGMGPLALMAKAAGIEVFGTDLHEGAIYPELVEAGIEAEIGPEAQNGEFLREKLGFAESMSVEGEKKERKGGGEENGAAEENGGGEERSESGGGEENGEAEENGGGKKNGETEENGGGEEKSEGGREEEGAGKGVDWFVYTSALPEDHAELTLAREARVRCTKRDDFTAFLIEELGLKLVAVAGTHGKTTTTAMIIWAATQLRLPVAYLVGSTLSFAPSGAYQEGDQFFVYEADEYDRNFLKFHPWLAVLPAVSYDHPDIYPTREDYEAAFRQFCGQSEKVVDGAEILAASQGFGDSEAGREGRRNLELGREGLGNLESDQAGVGERREKKGDLGFRTEEFGLAGEARRLDAALAATAVLEMWREIERKAEKETETEEKEREEEKFREELIELLNEFPGVGRRFERLAEGIYTDYAHHPEEIAATIEMAREEAKKRGFTGVTVIYEPHQNSRQHEVRDGYKKAFLGAERIIWLPTYLTREDPDLAILTPEELIAGLENKEVAETGEIGEGLLTEISMEREKERLVILMTAGPADEWLRGELGKLVNN